MTKYTRNRRYPYPASEREAGNGGLHSELLARSVAADLDVLDAGWAAEFQHSTAIFTRTTDYTGISSGGYPYTTVFTQAVEKMVGSDISTNLSGTMVNAIGAGWYHVIANMRSRAEGAITAAALHRLTLAVDEPKLGSLVEREVRWVNTYQAGTGDVYNTLEGIFLLRPNDRLYLGFLHFNAAGARVIGSGTGGTRVTLTKIASA